MIVGGHAVGFHGYPRFTGGLDVWVAIDPANTRRLEAVLKDFGFGNLFNAEDFSRPGYAIQLGRPPYRIDLLTSIDAVDFALAYKRRRRARLAGLVLPFIGLGDLLANKRAAGRAQDLADVARLEAKDILKRGKARSSNRPRKEP